MGKFQSEVISNEPLSEDVKHLVLVVPENFTFAPGQYVSLILDKDGKRIRRPYSIASPPNGNTVELCIKIIPEGLITPTINNYEQGQTLELLGPLGDFIIEDLTKELIFISAGTGVGPFRSMIYDLLNKGHNKPITLIAGYRNNILYDEEFKELANKHSNFEYKVALSSQGARVQNVLPIKPEAHYYLCGLQKMIGSTRNILAKQGVPMSSIMSEKYD